MKALRFAFRQLRKTPGFSRIAILTLGLEIGTNTFDPIITLRAE
jgi:hypothetical protein